MTGKSYSMSEMKAIVNYLTENKLYGEIKGRKMWMDFANSQLTTRTWQSLKEAFLKRILPDIHNPYYRLSIEQINSFRAGYDIAERDRNKLEINTVTDDSSSNGVSRSDIPQSNNGLSIKQENVSGENIKSSKIPPRSRSSADTVIVDTCYETAEDIQKELESPTNDKDSGETKSLRDCITYSEPLTPMLQEVLDDFQSEPENEPDTSDRENQLEIVESAPNTDNSENVDQEILTTVKDNEKSKEVAGKDVSEKTNEVPEKERESIVSLLDDQTNTNNQGSKSDIEKELEMLCSDTKTDDNRDSNSPTGSTSNLIIDEGDTANENPEATDRPIDKNVETAETEDLELDNVIKIQDSNESIPASGPISSSADASFPNNPEALVKKTLKEKQQKTTVFEKPVSEKQTLPEDIPVAPENKQVTSGDKSENKSSRKRSNSDATICRASSENKKTKFDKGKTKARSETESKTVSQKVAKKKSKIIEPNDKPTAIGKTPKNKDEKTVSQDGPILPDIIEKPSTSASVIVTSGSDPDESSNVNESSEIKNPCLQNVSLFEEQLKKTKYTSESSDIEKNKKKTEEKKEVFEKPNEVVILRSHTESDREESPPHKKKHRPGVASTKTEREKALSNVFGLSSGAAHSRTNRRRQLSRHKRTISQNTQNKRVSESSEWTSLSDSDTYVSPPRGRKHRHTRKYLKPRSARILSLEDEGGLFVMYGRKIYPLMKDGKLVKNYLTYLPESESEEEGNFWKSKYVEEKKKADELKKLLEKTKESRTRRSTSTATQADHIRTSTCIHNQPHESSTNVGKEICLPSNIEKKEEPKPIISESIKIKFTTKNDQEIHLEGNWPQIHNVLEHVVQVFHKQPVIEPVVEQKTILEPPSSSGISTPLVITAVQDPEVHEKVNKLESEIFKEIEERDKEEDNLTSGQELNITKRRPGRPRKSSQSSTSQSPAKRQKLSNEPQTADSKEAEQTTDNKVLTAEAESNVSNESPRRQVRTSRQILNDSPNTDTQTVKTRRAKLNSSIVSQSKEEEEVRYMFPPRNTRHSKPTTEKKTRDRSQKR